MKTQCEINDRVNEYPQGLPSMPADSDELTRPISQYRDAALHKPESTPDDISAIGEKGHSKGKIVNVILETCLLTRQAPLWKM
jgi:hypothetical protein